MFWYFYIFLLGLTVGSFANVVIFRLPRSESIITGRSRCVNCGKKIAWYDLIPVISFFILRFRCRNCHKPISWQYSTVELYSGIIFLLAFLVVGRAGIVSWIFAVFVLESLLILALIDFKNLILPDSIILVMFLGVLVYGVWERLVGSYLLNIFSFNSLAGAAILFSAFFILWFLSKGLWLGLGDAKLSGLIGLIFGLWGGLLVVYGAIIAGTITGLLLLVKHKAGLKTKLPLGTFICFSATAYVFFGTSIQSRLADYFYSIPLILK